MLEHAGSPKWIKMIKHDHVLKMTAFQYDDYPGPNPFLAVLSCFIALFKLSHLLSLLCNEFSNKDLPHLSPPEPCDTTRYDVDDALTAASWCGANTCCHAAVARLGRRRPAATPRHPKSLASRMSGWNQVGTLLCHQTWLENPRTEWRFLMPFKGESLIKYKEDDHLVMTNVTGWKIQYIWRS